MFHLPWPEMHGAVTHFPIALLLTGFVFEIAGLIWRKDEWQRVAFWIVSCAVVMAVPSAVTGWIAGSELYGRAPSPVFIQHRFMAFTTLVLGVILLIWLWTRRAGPSSRAVVVTSLVLMTLASLSVSYTGYLGGKLVFGDTGAASETTSSTPSTAQAKPIVASAQVISEGQSAFNANGCTGCHALNGVGAHTAPDLTHEGTRNSNVSWQEAHLKNPSKVRPGSSMPSYSYLPPDQLHALAVFLASRQ